MNMSANPRRSRRSRSIGLAAALIVLSPIPCIRSQARPSSRPRFEVASIKACKPDEVVPGGTAGGGQGKSGDVGPVIQSPGRLSLRCQTTENLIEMAYVSFADGQNKSMLHRQAQIEKGARWIGSDRYAITAKAVDATPESMMRGPMLQALLEDRFKLKIHRETREGSVYDLTTTGIRMRPTSEGSCEPRNPMQYAQAPPLPGEKPWCSTFKYVSSRSTMTGILDGIGISIPELCARLPVDRPIVDKTGLTGMFDFHLEYLRDGGPPPSDSDTSNAAPSVFVAIRSLGLKLTPARGPIDVWIIDHVAKPSDN
jgi:uncharacterized protein (TIGR03435 family)